MVYSKSLKYAPLVSSVTSILTCVKSMRQTPRQDIAANQVPVDSLRDIMGWRSPETRAREIGEDHPDVLSATELIPRYPEGPVCDGVFCPNL
jgi:hypothetical protein